MVHSKYDNFDIINNIKTIENKVLSTLSYSIKARVALSKEDYGNLAYQSGCVFKQDNTMYSAFWMASDNAQLIDKLVIINIDTNVVVSNISLEAGHGQCPTYNPNTKELAVCSPTKIYYINVSNPIKPYVSKSYTTPNISGYGRPNVISWDDSDYNSFYVLKLDQVNNDMLLLKTSIDFNLIEVIPIDVFDEWAADYQSISVNKGIVYLSESKPENIVMCDVKTGKRLNVINIPDFIGFLPIREIEWSSCVDDIIYFSQANYYPGYVVPVIFKYNMKDGTVTAMEWFKRMTADYERKTNQYVLIAWNKADLRNPFNVPAGYGRDRPMFKFIEDAVNYAKYYNLDIMISFEEDYPSYAAIQNFSFELHPTKPVKVGGLSIYNCNVIVINGSYITFTGENSSIIHSATYSHAVRVEASRLTLKNIWNCKPINSLSPSNGQFVESWISGYALNDFGVGVFASCVIMAKSSAHSKVINQLGTIWLNG